MAAVRVRWAVWRSPVGQPAWARPVLLLVTALAAAAYAWRTASQQPEILYAAAVRSMAGSWHDFVFAAVDPRGTITVDKLPGALWMQALSVRAFGLHLWALNLPQIVEGSLTTLVLFRAVRRLGGVAAATTAVVGYACMPATVGLNRGNISDSLLILLLVCAADAVAAAITGQGNRHLAWAGLWVGLAFQAKMMQAWLVLPAFVLVWLVAGPPALARRFLSTVVMLAVAAVVSLSWITVATAIPEHDRPYVDGSRHDSYFEQVFEYNGFARDVGQEFGVERTGATTAAVQAQDLFQHGRADRTIAGPGGRAIGYLIPVAVLGAAFGLLWTRRRARGDPIRAAILLWSGWLVIDGAAFNVAHRINAYYLAALTPPIVALLGIAAVCLAHAVAHRRRVGLIGAVAALGSVAYAAWLLSPAPTGVRIGAAVVGGGLAIAAATLGGRGGVAGACAAVLIAPATATAALLHAHGGPFVTPYQPADQQAASQADVAVLVEESSLFMAGVLAANASYRYPLTTYTSYFAAAFIFASGAEVLPIGGYTGTIPSPTLAQLITYVRRDEMHLIELLPTSDPRAEWVRAHCHQLPTRPGRITSFFCTPGDASSRR